MAIVEITPAAEDRIKALLDRDGKLESHGLRIKVIGGGCSGLQYQLGFDDRVTDDDNEFRSGPVRILVDDIPGCYRALGIIHLQNLSVSGAHGLTDMPLAPGAIVFLELKRARFYAATVNWAERLGIGIEFNRPLRPELMKKLLAQSKQKKKG